MIGPFEVSTYVLTYAVAILVGGMVALWRLGGLGLPRRKTLPALAASIVVGMLGSVTLWWLMSLLSIVLGRPEWFAKGGSTILGVLLFGLPATVLSFRVAGLPVAPSVDKIFSTLPLGQAIGRIGCLLAGCCAGRPTASWIALNLPEGHQHWCPRYPAQLIASAADLVIFVALLLIDRSFGTGRKAGGAGLNPGELTAAYFLLYGTKRFAMEFIRLNQNVLGPFTWAQLIAASVVAAAVAWIFLRRRRQIGAT